MNSEWHHPSSLLLTANIDNVSHSRLPPVDLEAFPSHLSSLCLQNFRAYTSLLLPLSSMPPLPDDKFLIKDGDISVEMSGNWYALALLLQ